MSLSTRDQVKALPCVETPGCFPCTYEGAKTTYLPFTTLSIIVFSFLYLLSNCTLHMPFSPANLAYPLGPEQPHLILLLKLTWLPFSES